MRLSPTTHAFLSQAEWAGIQPWGGFSPGFKKKTVMLKQHEDAERSLVYRLIQTKLVRTKSISRRRQWHPTPVLLPGKSHGWRSLVGCSPWGCKESDTTERLHFHFPLSCIGEGNGNPPQYSCLENPRDGGVRWAAVYGVAQSRTWLKWLSSSKSISTTYL